MTTPFPLTTKPVPFVDAAQMIEVDRAMDNGKRRGIFSIF